MSFDDYICSYFAIFDGTEKDLSQFGSHFDGLFHDDFHSTVGEKSINKGEMRELCMSLLALGTKATLVNREVLSPANVKYQIHYNNEMTESECQLMLTIKENKIVQVDTVDAKDLSSLMAILQTCDFHSLEQKFHALASMHDGTINSFNAYEKFFEDLIHDEFILSVNEFPVNKARMKELYKALLEVGTKAEVVEFRPLDDRFQVGLHFASDEVELMAYATGIMKDGKVVKLDPYEIQTFANERY